MSTRRTKAARKARVVKQTQFDRQLMRVEELVREFHDLLEQAQHSPRDRENILVRLYAIRMREYREAVYSLQWAMKHAQMRAFPLEANGL